MLILDFTLFILLHYTNTRVNAFIVETVDYCRSTCTVMVPILLLYCVNTNNGT